MRILYITGDEYAAMNVEGSIGIKEATRLTEENGGKLTIETDEIYAELEIREFGDVCEKFIDFVSANFIDYDQSKSTDFYVIPEKE